MDSFRQFVFTLVTKALAGVLVTTFEDERDVNMSENNLYNNIFLQCKRTSKLLEISLSKSKDLIARAVYQCHDYAELCQRLSNSSLKSTVYPYSKIHPNADQKLVSFLESNIRHLCKRFSELLITPVSPLPLLDLIWKIFGFSKRGNLSQHRPHVQLNNWYLLDGLNSENESALYSTFLINSVPFKIIFTKVVTPSIFTNNTVAEVQKLNKNFSRAKLAPMMWSKFEEWQNAVNAYVESSDSSHNAFRTAFKPVHSQRNELQKSFENLLNSCLEVVLDEHLISEIRFVNICDCKFYVIGYPIADDSNSDFDKEITLTDAHITNGKCILGFNEDIICVDLVETDANGVMFNDSENYFSSLSDAMRSFEDYVYQTIKIGDKRYQALVRPCTQSEYDNYFRYPAVSEFAEDGT